MATKRTHHLRGSVNPVIVKEKERQFFWREDKLAVAWGIVPYSKLTMPNFLLSRVTLVQLFLGFFITLLLSGEAFISTRVNSCGSCASTKCCLFTDDDNLCSRRNFIAATVATATLASSTLSGRASADATEISRNNYENSINAPTTTSQTTNAKEKTDDVTSALQESISGFISGTVVSSVKTIVKYPLDTATVRLQMPETKYTLQKLPELFDGSFDGITGPLLSNIPAGAIFFAVKDAMKSAVKGAGLPRWASTSIAVAAALPPYWAIRNPSEVIKTRLQVGADGYSEGMSVVDAFQLALSRGNITSLYTGYSENVLYGFPADVIKFVVYDYLSGGKKNLSPVNGAMYGAISTGIAQWLTTPLDVVRNRIMAEVNDNSEDTKLNYVGRLVKIAEEEGVNELFAGTTPRIAKAMLSGALQFAAYEETKQKVADFFARR